MKQHILLQRNILYWKIKKIFQRFLQKVSKIFQKNKNFWFEKISLYKSNTMFISLSVCLFVLKDPANRWTDMVHFKVASTHS